MAAREGGPLYANQHKALFPMWNNRLRPDSSAAGNWPARARFRRAAAPGSGCSPVSWRTSRCSTMRSAAARLPAALKSGDCPFRNAVTRISRSMSLEVITRLPTETAMRSMMAPQAGIAASAAASARAARRMGAADRNSSFVFKTSVLWKRRTENG